MLVTLWDLLLGVCFFTPIYAGFQAAKQADAAFGGYVIAIAAGALIGCTCSSIMWTVGKISWTYGRNMRSKSLQKWFLRIAYFSSILWILLSTMLGAAWTPYVLRLLR
jgi:hypothetical protein